jgi:2-oxoglutarate ferredoxin oxidoreductase subunit alpha
VIYDPKLAETPLDRLPSMDKRVQDDLKSFLTERGRGETLGDLLQVAAEQGLRLYAVPYDEMIGRLADHLGQPVSRLKKTANTMAVAASCALLDYGVEWLEKALANVFHGKEKIVEINVQAAELVYEHVARQFDDEFPCRLEPREIDEPRIYITGNQAVALGKAAAGCSVQTYYPISPATDESVYLESHQVLQLKDEGDDRPKQGALLVVQTEDEIAAINMAIGAAIAGARAATSTSGPGFCLMVEGLGFAGMNEVPVVVTLYQRGGPSTGLPTRSEQGDLWFALHAGHGEFPRLVLASGDLEEAFYDAIRAFNWAECYQVPVIHLLDKSIASGSETRPLYDVNSVKIDRGRLLTPEETAPLSEDGAMKRFRFSEDGISPRTTLGTPGGISWLTSDEHDEWGHITEDPVIRVRMMEKRMKKLETAAREIPLDEKLNVFGDPNAENVVLSWGSPKGAILEAMEQLRGEGFSIKFVQVRLLRPLPVEKLTEHLASAERRIAVENNFSGQLAGLVRQETGIPTEHLVVKYNGRPMTIDEVYEALKGIITGKAPQKVVLTHGA